MHLYNLQVGAATRLHDAATAADGGGLPLRGRRRLPAGRVSSSSSYADAAAADLRLPDLWVHYLSAWLLIYPLPLYTNSVSCYAYHIMVTFVTTF